MADSKPARSNAVKVLIPAFIFLGRTQVVSHYSGAGWPPRAFRDLPLDSS